MGTPLSIMTKTMSYYCRSHYVEYLCFLIHQYRLETLSILKSDDLETLVRRENRRMPPKPYGILEGIYRQYLAEVNFLTFSFFLFSLFNIITKWHFWGCCFVYRSHYVEYLVSVIYDANLDPLPILDLTDCVQELRRRGIPLPERGPWDTDPIYREMCLNVKRLKVLCLHENFV